MNNTSTAGANLGSLSDSFSNVFVVRGYYKDAYVFLLKWNINKKNMNTDSSTTKVKVKLSDQSEKTVYFDSSCRNNAKEEAVLTVLGKLLSQINDHPEEDLMIYADPIWVFASVLSELDSKQQQQYAKRAYEDDKIDVFSLVSDNLSKEELTAYAKKAYESDRINFFSVLSDNLSKEELKAYKTMAIKDGKTSFFHILSDY